jgi:glucokinase
MAVQGDQPAQEIFAKVGRALGIVVADLVNIFNLPMYVIGGGVASAWEAFSPSMMEEVERRSFVYRATAPKPNLSVGAKKTLVTRALLGSAAGLYGAARLPMVATTAEAVPAGSRRRA